MAAIAGRVAKVRKHNNTTLHQKNHRWESFSTKISKLNSLDPLRKVRRHDLDEENLSVTTSYFRNGISKWAGLNISKPFTNFKREIYPLCETLPQIVHHQANIFDILATYISTQDKEALEPLLDLLTAFAHDFGLKFEKYYQRSLQLLIAIAGKSQGADVIEWTFGALAWLFKYLSKLIVPDLRPTYDVLSGLLGKAKHPVHINRLAAESMSFLIKKAASPNYRRTALPRIVQHARDDLKDLARKLARKNKEAEADVADHELDAVLQSSHFEMYKQGVMTMFSEAMKSSGNNSNSNTNYIFEALLLAVPVQELEPGNSLFWTDVCCGVLTNHIHHSTPESFAALITSIGESANQAIEDTATQENPYRLAIFPRLFGIIAGVRDGSRINDWTDLIKMLMKTLEALSKGGQKISSVARPIMWEDLVVHVAICWSQAPMDALIPSLNVFNKIMTGEPLMRWYIPFCKYLAELNGARFRSLFQKPFQRFITAHWSEDSNEDLLCVLLPRLVGSGALPRADDKEGCPLPQSWQDQIVNKFEELGNTPFPEQGSHGQNPEDWRDRCLPRYAALLRVLESTNVHPSTSARIAELLLKKLKLALRPSSSLDTEETQFIVTQGFMAYLKMAKVSGTVNHSLGPLLKAAAPRFSSSATFLETLLGYENEMLKHEKDRGSESPVSEDDPFVLSLVNNLASASRPLRLASLRMFEILPFTPDQDSCLSTMIIIEQLPLDHQSPRVIAVHLRRLAVAYTRLNGQSWLRQAVPAYLFGMLTIPLAPVWDDAVEALKQVAEVKSAGELIFNRAFSWLRIPSPRWSPPQSPSPDAKGYAGSSFACIHFSQLQGQSRATGEALEAPSSVLRREFEQLQHDVAPEYVPNARSKALKVLSATPALAEKRSRKIVPFLLSLDEAQTASSDDEEEESVLPENDFWSLPDKKALIGVFAQVGNPKVLFKSQQVYSTLLSLLANRDLEVQKLALKAIHAWKQEGVKPYKENLDYLLDEARFKNELTVFLQGENPIQAQHRAELMPVLLRVLYGRATSKKGAASGRNGLHATRLAILRNLSIEDVGGFLDIALGRLQGVRVVDASGLEESLFLEQKITPRQQVGFLNMVQSIINEIGTSVERYMDPLVNAVLYCLFSASRNLRQGEQKDENDDMSVDDDKASSTSLYRVARTTALKCLCGLLKNSPSFDWTPYQDSLVAEIVTPVIRLPEEEMAQGVSWTWRLLETWSLSPRTATALGINAGMLPKIADCIGFEKSKTEVRIVALGIIQNLVRLAQAPETGLEFASRIKADLLDPNADKILSVISAFLQSRNDIEIRTLEACIGTVVEISSAVDGSRNARNLVDISTHLLNQPARRVSPKVKGSLLLVLEHYITADDIHNDALLKQSVYKTLASLFNFFKDKRNRESLSKVLLAFATRDPAVEEVARICANLNAYAAERLDEPDYDRRLLAFNAVRRRKDPLTLNQWMPLLHSFVFYLSQDEEFGILCSNSTDGLCKFIDAAAEAWGTEAQSTYVDILGEVILPAIQAGVREPSETVRRETIRLLGYLVTRLGGWAPVSDLAVLVPSDEDSSNAFFSNILTPSVSKQLQAVQWLTAANEQSEFTSKNVAHIFLPLLEHFIFDRGEGDDHGLGAQAAATVASLSRSLEWSSYRAVVRRYISYLQARPELHKQVIRLLDKLVESLVAAVDSKTGTAMEVEESAGSTAVFQRRLTRTVPAQDKMAEEFGATFTPPLLAHLHDKNEETVSARVPVAVILVKLLRLLPDNLLSQQLPSVLTDICHILRSKSWESREMSRSTLAKIAVILGAPSFGFILKELRGALSSGTQLHVLSYTLHTLLLAVIPEFEQGDLDYCLEPMVTVIMDDVFGVSGQEKDEEGYISKMKEVKSSKSQDSMELIASTASITQLMELVRPLQALLIVKLTPRMVGKIDHLLNRIASGLQKNPAAASRDSLIFCYEVVLEVYKSRKPEAETRFDSKLRKYLVQKGAKREDRGAASKHTYKLLRFAIDILRSVLRKHESLRTAANLRDFLPILGDAIVDGEEELKIAAFKLLTVLVRVPSKAQSLHDLYKVAAKDATKCIAQSLSTTTDLAQTALKLLAAILRDRREIVIKDAAIDTLLGKLKDDLTEPEYRHVTFNFLRSVLDRKIETAVVYDTLDYVGTVMITNDDKDTRDLARGGFFQFLREYPQKKNRWTKQLEFIIANLTYPRESGRLSVMEIVHLLLMKSADEFVTQVAAMCYFPLVMVLANDDSVRCRLSARELMKQIFRRADNDRLLVFLAKARAWVGEDDNLAVLKLAFQVFGLYFEAREPVEKDKKDVELLVGKITSVLADGETVDWDLVNTALNLVHVLVDKQPARLLAKGTTELWTVCFSCMSHEHPAVKLNAVKLLARYLRDFASNNAAVGKGRTVTGAHDQKLEQEQIAQIIRLLLETLRDIEVEEALAQESMQILVFVSRFLNTSVAHDAEDSDDEEETEKHQDDFLEDTEGAAEKQPATMTMRYVFSRLAAVLRREVPRRAPALVSKLAAIDALARLAGAAGPATVALSARTILRPMRSLTDATVAAPGGAGGAGDALLQARGAALRARAQEVMDGLQAMLGTAEYTRQLLAVGEEMRARRAARSCKRKVAAVAAPARYEKDKRRKVERKKDRRKEKAREHRNQRRGY